MESTDGALASPCLDLSKRDLSELPETRELQHVMCLYLEGNHLRELPESLFSCCLSLRWLDLRNNHLTRLPAAIQNLRELKTLLLQGNQLTHLPPELGELQQLKGLGLANNPLSCPPPGVVRRGTTAVLQYLRGRQCAAAAGNIDERGGREGDSINSDTESDEDSTTAPQWHQHVKHTALTSHDSLHCQQRLAHQPMLLPRQAHIHPHPPPPPSPHHLTLGHTRQRREQVRGGERQRRGGGITRQTGRGGQRERGQERVIVHVPPLTSEEKLQANIQIEKQRSKESLEQWRAEARLDHLQPPPNVELGTTAHTTAPFAIDTQSTPTQHPSQSDRDIAPPLLRGEEEMVRVRVQRYNQALQAQRRQAGLISDASSDLLQAERRLAQALAQRDEVEDRKKREYRLTAFTADPNLM